MVAPQNILFFLSALACVSAHGYMPSVTIAGKEYKGNGVGESTMDSAIRMVTAQDPMKGADNKDLSCGPGSTAAKLSADANPGDKLEIAWAGEYGNDWIHEVGPMLTYMALCGDDGSEDCADVDSSKAKWFKIDEQGIEDDGTWAQAALKAGQPAKLSLPSDIAPGNYLLRHEILALHNALSEGGAEFYAGCAQLSVKGSGTGTPSDDELVLFPGAYKDADPGITVPTIYDNMKKGDYKFPGPDVSKLASSGGGSGGSDDGGDDEGSSSSSTKPTSTATSSSEGATGTPSTGVNTHTGSCKLKRRSASGSSLKKRGTYHPKRFSRVMRDLASSKHL